MSFARHDVGVALIVLLIAVFVIGSIGYVLWTLVEDRLPRVWNELYRDDVPHTANDTLYDANYGHPIDVVAEIRRQLAQIPREPSLRWETYIERKGDGDRTQAVLIIRLINIKASTVDGLGMCEVNLTNLPDRGGRVGDYRWDVHYAKPPMSRRDATRAVTQLLVAPTIAWARTVVDKQLPPPTLDDDYRII